MTSEEVEMKKILLNALGLLLVFANIFSVLFCFCVQNFWSAAILIGIAFFDIVYADNYNI